MVEALLRSKLISGTSEDQLREVLVSSRSTDGLPVILPTVERVEEMLAAAALAGFDRDIVLGAVGPNLGEATVEKVAINAVMAGCQPQHLPIVIAAMSAICDPRLDTTEVQVTTHQLAPLLIISGAAVKECDIASGFGALGYGHRANLSIGRAVRLCLINLGGTWPGVSDMSLLGQPGMVSYCVGEDSASSPFEPFHVSQGFALDASAVTVACVGSPHSVIGVTNADDPGSVDRLLDCVAATIASVGNNNATNGQGTVVVCLNPDHAAVLGQAGMSRADVQQELWKRAGHPKGYIQRLRYGSKIGEIVDPDAFRRATQAPEAILVFVAGGPGLYSTVMTPWGGGPHGNTHVSKEIVLYDMCEVVGPPTILT